jgi:hypothetical protein
MRQKEMVKKRNVCSNRIEDEENENDRRVKEETTTRAIETPGVAECVL